MVRIILHGCNGYMGRVLSDMIAAESDTEVVAGIDVSENDALSYPVFTDIMDCEVPADVVIDFSTAKAVDALLSFCVKRELPLVLCTTGLSEEQLAKVKESSGRIAVLRSANMSVGVNLVLKLLRDAAKSLAPAGYDMEIVERHHNRKLDAPSGTALALGEALREGAGEDYYFVLDRSARREKRDPKEIGIQAVRGGSIVGDHEVLFAGQDEVIEIRHSAYSRAIFGKGAMEAAKYLAGKPAGLYTMSDVIG